MKKDEKKICRSLFSPWSFLIFFVLAAFTVSCSFLLFFYGAGISEEVVRSRAGITFFNVVFLSAIFTLVDTVRRNYWVKHPIMQILDATQKIRQGDFTVRIPTGSISSPLNELGIIMEDINKMAEELSGLETLRTDFIANVSHELKTPLAVIQNYATLLQVPDLDEDKRLEYAKTLADSSQRFSSLITNILRLNKLENQQIFPENREFDLGEQLCECLLDFESLWEQKDLRIDTEIAPDIRVEADAELLGIVWQNLFSNAIKFTDKGGVVSVSLEQEGDLVVVQVSDTGCGISSETGKHIFEKFYQGDTSHATQGNGLGLALVKRIVDIMQGEIMVESVLGKGSIFTVKLKGGGNGTG